MTQSDQRRKELIAALTELFEASRRAPVRLPGSSDSPEKALATLLQIVHDEYTPEVCHALDMKLNDEARSLSARIRSVRDYLRALNKPPSPQATPFGGLQPVATVGDGVLEGGGRYFLDEYHPYWLSRGVRNPKFDEHSGLILDLKAEVGEPRRANAVRHFAQLLRPVVPPDAMLAYVPSSDPANTNTGVRELARRLCGSADRDATGCIVRTRQIQPLHAGGRRCRDTHVSSLQIRDRARIAGQHVLLIDDVTTSGTSLEVCAELLIEAGARVVTTLALGETSHAQ